MATESKMIMDALNEIRHELRHLRKNLSEVDAVLTDEDIEALQEADKDHTSGKTVKLLFCRAFPKSRKIPG
ncbi:hypothetical protein J4212_01880 [Candidatus Woesearchaeota archaeon]|nr:hypothetical protein [Candidatus Woesearchaeota archaeon]